MPTSLDLLHTISSSSALDIATGRGDFLLFLQQNLAHFGAGTGIDIKPSEAWKSEDFIGLPIQFAQMDAGCLNFPDGEFDLVSISNSLHHLPDPHQSIAEMVRVLQSGGKFILREMFSDGLTPEQQTHDLLHRWWGEIDTVAGIFHRSPYTLSELIALLEQSGITQWDYFNEKDLSGDPLDPEMVTELDEIIDTYQKKTTDSKLMEEGDRLRERVHSIGFKSATQLFAIGVKK